MGLKEDLERIAMQERELVLPRLDAQIAWDFGIAIEDNGCGTRTGRS